MKSKMLEKALRRMLLTKKPIIIPLNKFDDPTTPFIIPMNYVFPQWIGPNSVVSDSIT